jgi:hypothetical protein
MVYRMIGDDQKSTNTLMHKAEFEHQNSEFSAQKTWRKMRSKNKYRWLILWIKCNLLSVIYQIVGCKACCTTHRWLYMTVSLRWSDYWHGISCCVNTSILIHTLNYSSVDSRYRGKNHKRNNLVSHSYCHVYGRVRDSYTGLDWWSDLLYTALHKPLRLPFSIIFDCRLKRLPQFYFSAGLWSSLYSLGATPTENMLSKQFLYFNRGVFTSPLHRNGSSSIVPCEFVAAGMCLPSRCLVIDVCSGSTILDFRRNVTISSTKCLE